MRPQRSDESSGCPDDDAAVVPYATPADRPIGFPPLVLFAGLEPNALPVQLLSEVRAIDAARRSFELALAPSTLAAQCPIRSSVAAEHLTDDACHVLVQSGVAVASKSGQTVRTVCEKNVFCIMPRL